LTAPRCDIDKVRERGETWAVDPELVARARDEVHASTADFCRHTDEVGESLRAEVRGLAVLIARYGESLDRRFDQRARRLDRLDGWISTLETRTSSLEDDRKPRRPRRRR
jgi:hypothetical protein